MNARLTALFAALALVASAGHTWAQKIAPDTELRVKLLGPLSTETNKKGDTITAQVVSPDAFKGDVVEGKVTESKGSGKIRGESVLNFTFETIHHAGASIPIQSQVKSVLNSKGVENVDEEGRMIQKTNNLGKAAVATGLGALIGGIAGGAKGAAIGAGVGAAASIVFIKVATRGPSIRFDPGSEFVLTVKEREAQRGAR